MTKTQQTTPAEFPEYSDNELDTFEELYRLSFRPNGSEPPPPETVVLSLGGIPIARTGGISSIQGREGVGKSALVEGAIAASCAIHSHEGDFLGWKRETERRGVIHFDCEQSRADHYALCQRAKERAGNEAENLHSSCVTGWNPDQIRLAIELMLIEDNYDGHGAALVIIDGFADLVHSVLDASECDESVRWLMLLAKRYDVHIMGVMHVNPSSGGRYATKARGHLGSNLRRKAETVLELNRKADGSVHITTDKARKSPLAGDSAVRMRYDTTAGRWASLESVGDMNNRKNSEASRQLLGAAWGEDVSASYGYTDLSRILAASLSLSLSAGKKKVGSLTSEKLIETRTAESGRNSYHLTTAGKAVLAL